MGRSVSCGLPVRRAGNFYRTAMMLLAFVYLFVGVAHNVWCLDEAVASTLAVAMEKSPDRSDDSLPKAGISLCDHCPTCVPALMPEPASVAVRSALAAEPVVMTTEWIVAAHPRLETPPPKFLT